MCNSVGQTFTPYLVPNMAINKENKSRAGNMVLAGYLLQHGMQSLLQLLRRLLTRLVAWATTAACRLTHACQKPFRQALQSRVVKFLLEALQRAYARAAAALSVSASNQPSAELQSIQVAAAENCQVSSCPIKLSCAITKRHAFVPQPAGDLLTQSAEGQWSCSPISSMAEGSGWSTGLCSWRLSNRQHFQRCSNRWPWHFSRSDAAAVLHVPSQSATKRAHVCHQQQPEAQQQVATRQA